MEVTAGEASSAAAAGEGGSNHQSSSSGGLQQPEQEAAYAVKRVRFFGREVPIFLQNLNGPCPLLSIANVLSLRNELKLPSRKAREVSQSQLITLVAERLLEAGNRFDDAPQYAADMQQNVSDAFDVLQKLSTGVDVNVKVRASCVSCARAGRRRPSSLNSTHTHTHTHPHPQPSTTSANNKKIKTSVSLDLCV